MISFIYFILGAILIGIFFCGCAMGVEISFLHFILGAILIGIFFCDYTIRTTEISKEQQSLNEANQDRDLERRKKEEWKKAWFELYYDDGNKEYEFWTYFGRRERGKLTYIVPEFEERIVKMNKLKKGRD